MGSESMRLYMQVWTVPENDTQEQMSVDSAFYRINNVLSGSSQMPNATAICEHCKTNGEKLGACIRRTVINFKGEIAVLQLDQKNPNKIFNYLEKADKKRLRVLLYPGGRDEISGLKVDEATHNMIIQFDSQRPNFVATERHDYFPSFYQVCNSVETALLYIEGLLIDACMCHYMMISNAAYHHDEKQDISKEKVDFLRELSQSSELEDLSEDGKQVVIKTAASLSEDTPYISFLSIFTISNHESNTDTEDAIAKYFDDYCCIWKKFQIWFYKKHGRLFSQDEEIGNPINRLFTRNKFHGQISLEDAIDGIKSTLSEHSITENVSPLANDNGYAFVILKNLPSNPDQRKILEALFRGQLHQAKWQIISWNEFDKYQAVRSLVELVPFMID